MTCEACRTIPPVLAEGYVEAGTWGKVGTIRTYITGPPNATNAIIDIYDIFGIAPQTIQGADGLSKALNARVFVPDWFEKIGGGAKGEWFADKSEEAEKAKNEFLAKAFKFPEYTGKLNEFVENAKRDNADGVGKGIEKWGCFGLCWGGKVTALASGSGSPFVASGQVHPGKLDVEDAKKIIIPHIILASKGEDEEEVRKCKEVLVGQGKSGVVESYMNMHHGWMGARANLSDPENAKEFERGYNQLADFFAKHL